MDLLIYLFFCSQGLMGTIMDDSVFKFHQWFHISLGFQRPVRPSGVSLEASSSRAWLTRALFIRRVFRILCLVDVETYPSEFTTMNTWSFHLLCKKDKKTWHLLLMAFLTFVSDLLKCPTHKCVPLFFFAGIYWYWSPFTRRHDTTSLKTRHFMRFIFWQRGIGTDRGGEETLGFRVSEPNVGSTVNREKDDIYFQRWCCFLRAGWVVKKLLLFLW